MPTSALDLYHMQDARNNFDAMRPAPICGDANQFMGQCQNVHISTNCYYGYHGQKSVENANGVQLVQYVTSDCEMTEAPPVSRTPGGAFGASASPLSNSRKRSADDADIPMTKRFREEVQRERNIEPETTQKLEMDRRNEDLLETLYWNIHGGNMFHLVQCV